MYPFLIGTKISGGREQKRLVEELNLTIQRGTWILPHSLVNILFLNVFEIEESFRKCKIAKLNSAKSLIKKLSFNFQ